MGTRAEKRGGKSRSLAAIAGQIETERQVAAAPGESRWAPSFGQPIAESARSIALPRPA